MPIYEYDCPFCDKHEEILRKVNNRNNPAYCSNCGGLMNRQEVPSMMSRDWFRPHWNEHFDTTKSIYVESKSHYKKLCKEYKMEARCLL